MSLHTEPIAAGAFLHTLPAEKFNRCRVSIHFRFPASRAAATDHALLPLVLERGYAACPDMTALSRKLAKLYGADLTVATTMQGACRVLSVSVTGIKDEFALQGERLSAEYAALAFGVAFEPYFENGEFSAEAVEIEKATLARQLESEINDKRLYCVRQAQRRFFGNSPAGVARDGYLEDLPAVTPASLTAAYKDILRTATIDVMVLGLDEAAVRPLLAAALEKQPRTPAPLPGYLAMPAAPAEHFEEKLDLEQAKLCMLFTMGRPADPEELDAYRMAMCVFGGLPTSRLFLNVREKQSLCYYCASRITAASACMMVDSGVEPANAQKAEAAILAELQKLAGGPIDPEELQNARLALASGMAGVGDSLAGLENWYFGEILRGGRISTPQEAAARLESIGADQVRQVLRRFTLSVSYLVTQKEETHG
ncbi:MAG TPA: insulinase family protein [Candidatus Fournierella merdigallinarum]|nr:insulinase family protein [Candidatus Fournierella merdigallinarum]